MTAERKYWFWLVIVLVTLIGAANALMGGSDGSSESPSPALSPQECAELQYDFDTAAMHSDTGAPGSAGSDQALAQMESLNRQMQDSGCYD